MNYNKSEKLNQITEKMLIVGIDVSKNFHVARAQDFRGIEFGKAIRHVKKLDESIFKKMTYPSKYVLILISK